MVRKRITASNMLCREAGHAPLVDSASWKLFTSNATGTITPAEEYAQFKAKVTGLAPETTYYVRVKASNKEGELIQTTYSAGTSEEVETFKTFTAKPGAGEPAVRNVTATASHVGATVVPHGYATAWRFESASEPSGPWSVVPGSASSISRAQVEALEAGAELPYDVSVSAEAELTGLSASSRYYVRLVTENQCEEGCDGATSKVASFETSGAPSAGTFMVHALDGEALRVLGEVNPNSEQTTAEQVITLSDASGGTFTLTFDGHTTVPIFDDATDGTVEHALRSLEGDPQVDVAGVAGGPYTVWFDGGDVAGAQPPIEAEGLGLTPPGAVSVAVTQEGGQAYDTHYGFRYVSEKSFDEGGRAEASETPEIDVGSGTSEEIVGADLPGLAAGETYRYRLVAHNDAPGTGLVEGPEEELEVPVAPTVGETGSCPNEAFRTGASSRLPDCRAYELLTPAEKGGTRELYDYVGGLVHAFLSSEDGEHAALEANGVNWGVGQAPYFFSRGEAGWSMIAGAPQPETGVYHDKPEIFSADRRSLAFSSSYVTSPTHGSARTEFKVGPAGGPYRTVVAVPTADASAEAGRWAAANGDLSKLVFATTDRTLLGEEPTGTKSGSDLYEYTGESGLRQLNVAGEGNATIGRCGARMALGREDPETSHNNGSPNSVSADGSLVFFEAIPNPSKCTPEEEDQLVEHAYTPNINLYMRVNGQETVDIGAYRFLGATPAGTTLLLEDGAGNLVGYDVETQALEPQSSGEVASAVELATLGIPYRTEPQGSDSFHHPRYSYFESKAVGGLPGGGMELKDGREESTTQVYRYDSVEDVVQCISCASSFDPKPALSAVLNDHHSYPFTNGGPADYTAVSANGEFAFFTTPAALVPQDIDGEIPVETEIEFKAGHGNGEYIDDETRTSPSSDVYEWRADGVDGCVDLQGCLALITNGRGGYMNLLLGSADEGRDVFIYTRSKLVSAGSRILGDIYDVRIDGGFAPPPPRPTECEGDACSSPPGAPNDATPSSLTFSGAGNLLGAAPVLAPKRRREEAQAETQVEERSIGRRRSGSGGASQAGRPERAAVKRRAGR